MTATLSYLPQLKIEATDPEERFISTGVNWQAYEDLLTRLGNSSCYRVAYLEGTLEIMSPSRSHERDKENIGRLLEAYFEETRTRFWGLGSTTFRRENMQAGKEPDKSYCIGTDKEFPDLAIEVVYTSGGIDSLAIYKRLGVTEVWFWRTSDVRFPHVPDMSVQDNQFKLYRLRNTGYEQIEQSELLPDLDLELLAKYVVISDPLEALIQWRQQIISR